MEAISSLRMSGSMLNSKGAVKVLILNTVVCRYRMVESRFSQTIKGTPALLKSCLAHLEMSATWIFYCWQVSCKDRFVSEQKKCFNESKLLLPCRWDDVNLAAQISRTNADPVYRTDLYWILFSRGDKIQLGRFYWLMTIKGSGQLTANSWEMNKNSSVL